jgi:hypothetical protein
MKASMKILCFTNHTNDRQECIWSNGKHHKKSYAFGFNSVISKTKTYYSAKPIHEYYSVITSKTRTYYSVNSISVISDVDKQSGVRQFYISRKT